MTALEVFWVVLSLFGWMGAFLLLVVSTRMLWRIVRRVQEDRDWPQAVEEWGEDIRDAYLTSFFLWLGVAALLPEGTLHPVAHRVLAISGLIGANVAIGLLCWLRWRRRRA